MKLTYLIVPGEFIIVDRGTYIARGYYIASESLGLVLALVLVLVWVLLERDVIINAIRRMSVVEYLYVAVLFSILFYTSYPSLYAFDRYHVSLNVVAEVYSRTLSFISYVVTGSMIILPILLVYMLSRHSRTAYALYIGIPLFTIILTYTFMLFIGLRFYYMVAIIPSLSLVPIALSIALDYVLGKEYV